MKEKIARWYFMNLWTRGMVKRATEKGLLTTEEAEAILGKSK